MGGVFDRFIMVHLLFNSFIKKEGITRDAAHSVITETSYFSYVNIKIINLKMINL